MMNDIQDLFERLSNLNTSIDKGVNVDRRIIYLSQAVDEEMATDFIRSMDVLESHDDEEKITVKISTFGGDVYSMLAIYDRMRSSDCEICTVASGYVMSAGILLIMGGDDGLRFAHENTQFMHHKGSMEIDGEHSNAVATVQHYEKLEDRVLKLIASRSKKNVAYWKKLEKSTIDKYFTATQAKTIGIIDHIIGNK